MAALFSVPHIHASGKGSAYGRLGSGVGSHSAFTPTRTRCDCLRHSRPFSGQDNVRTMREPLLVALGLFFVIGGIGTFLWLRTLERRTSQLGWTDPRQAFKKRRKVQFALCVAAAAGVYLLAIYGIGLTAGTANTNGFGLVLLLISAIWFTFRRDIARYQYQTIMTMINRRRPEQDEAQRQVKAMESVGIGFSVLLFSTGILLLTLNLVFA